MSDSANLTPDNETPAEGVEAQAAPADLRALIDKVRGRAEAANPLIVRVLEHAKRLLDGRGGDTVGIHARDANSLCVALGGANLDALAFADALERTLRPALHPTPADSQVTLNCARCVQNGETAANVAGATCGRCGNHVPAFSEGQQR